MVDLGALRRKFVLSLVLGVAVVLGLALYGNAAALASALATFQWALVPLALALTLANYGLRFVKWHYYLGQIGIRVSLGDSFAIFSSGLCMAMTPGKVGEVLKPVLLRLRTGTPVSRSLPVVMAERLTDGIAMVLLALGGLALTRTGWQIMVASLLLAVVVLSVLGSGHGTALVLRICRHLPLLHARLAMVQQFLESARVLFTPRNVALAVAIGVVSWGAEGLAFYLILTGLSLTPSPALLVQATFVLAASTLVGSLSMLPGGLGAADASVAGLLVLVVHLGRARAAAATMLIRFCTLWFGVTLGLAALWLFRNRFAGPMDVEEPTSIAALQTASKAK